MNTLIKEKMRTGTGWLVTLSVILSMIIVVYFVLHIWKTGTDHKTLDTTQLANIDNILSGVSDPAATATATAATTDTGKDTTALKNQREKQYQNNRLPAADSHVFGERDDHGIPAGDWTRFRRQASHNGSSLHPQD